jgi:hypothetical protein
VDARLAILQGYAARHLVHHLSQVDLALVDRDLKSEIGPDLVKLFNFGKAIDNLFWSTNPVPAFPDWMLQDRAVEEIQRWLKDSAVVLEVDECAQAWIARVMSDGRNPFEALLAPCATRLAMHCFRQPSSADLALATFQFILRFRSKVSIFAGLKMV